MVTACENPFRTDRLHALPYRLTDETWDEILSRWTVLNRRAAVAGPHGHGKSTFLQTMGQRLEALGFCVRRLFLNEAQPRFGRGFLRQLSRQLTSNDVILFDGCEQLNVATWWWFRLLTRRAGGLIVSVHTPGRLPTLYTCRTTPELLAELIQTLDPVSTCDYGAVADGLFDQHHGNIRDAFFSLYDRSARYGTIVALPRAELRPCRTAPNNI